LFLNLASPLIVVAGTWSAIGKYGFMDDYAILESSISGNFDFQLYMSQGRPFTAAYSYFIFSFIDNIDALIYLHVLGSLTLALFAWLLFTYFKDTIHNRFVLISISVIPILVSPGLLLVSAWAVMSSIGVSLVSSVSAAFLIRKRNRIHYFLALLLLTISFLSYPPSATIFMTLPCLAWVFSFTSFSSSQNQKELLMIVKRSALNIFVAGLLSLFTLLTISAQFNQTSNRTELIGDISSKANFLLRSAVPTALDYFEPNWGFSLYGWMTIVLVLGLSFICKSKKKLTNFVIVIALGIGATFAPLVLTAENWPSNRALFASQWILATLSVVSILHFINFFLQKKSNYRLVQVSTFILLGVSIFHSNNLLLTTMKNPQIKELNLARSAIATIDPTQKIEVKKSEWTDTLAPWIVGDEFGIPSTCQTWVPVPLTKLILKEFDAITAAEVVLVDKIQTSNALDFSRILNPAKS
jgi:hypothetical protein